MAQRRRQERTAWQRGSAGTRGSGRGPFRGVETFLGSRGGVRAGEEGEEASRPGSSSDLVGNGEGSLPLANPIGLD
jgi:hypothetical protein